MGLLYIYIIPLSLSILLTPANTSRKENNTIIMDPIASCLAEDRCSSLRARSRRGHFGPDGVL